MRDVLRLLFISFARNFQFPRVQRVSGGKGRLEGGIANEGVFMLSIMIPRDAALTFYLFASLQFASDED